MSQAGAASKRRRRRPPLPLGARGAQRGGCNPGAQPDDARKAGIVWLFDLDNTLHDASHAAFGATREAMGAYMVGELGLAPDEAERLRDLYLRRYGATLLGLQRHHGVHAAHFLEQTHRHPGLEERLRTSAHDRDAVRRLRGRKIIVTNAPRVYAMRVLVGLRMAHLFERVVSIEDMHILGRLRPKPDRRQLRHLAVALKVPPARCVLVEDTLANQKAARAVGMRSVWMQRYLGARFRGHLRGGVDAGRNNDWRPREVSVHPCPSPRYVYAKIRSLQQLLRLR